MSQLVTGTLVQSYTICSRQTWLMAHQIIPDQDHSYLEIGRLIDEKSYDWARKKVHLENVVLDLVRSEEGDLVVGEIKKSSRGLESARLQLAFYLYKLRKYGINAKGRLRFPEERRRIDIELDDKMIKEVEDTVNEIVNIITKPYPPSFKKIGFCKHCAYKEFCMS